MRTILINVILILGICSSPGSGQNYWSPTNGPFGGSVTSLVSETDSVLWAGTSSGGLFSSVDTGSTWVYRALDGFEIKAVVAMNNGLVFVGALEGIYRSTDHGATWTRVANYLCTSLASDRTGHIYAGTSLANYRSSDSGNTWQAFTGLPNIIECFAAQDSHNLWVGLNGGHGVHRSTNNGATWFPSNNGMNSGVVNGIVVWSSSFLFAGTYEGLYRSTDGGSHWHQVNVGLTSVGVLCLAADAAGTLFAGTNHGLFMSTDLGNQWTALSNGIPDISIRSLKVTGDFLFAGVSGAGVFRSDDYGLHFQRRSDGMNALAVKAVEVSPNHSIFAATSGGLFVSQNGGNDWVWLSLQYAPLMITPAGHLFAGRYRSTDNGATWILMDVPTFLISSYGRNANFLFVGLEGLQLCNGLRRSSDAGTTWMTTGSLPHCIYALTSGPTVDAYSAGDGWVARSVDDGTTWSVSSDGLAGAGIIGSLVMMGSTLIMAASANHGMYRSPDNGQTWSPSNAGLTTSHIHAVRADYSGALWAVTDDGVFRSTDLGSMWFPLNSGLTDFDVQCVAFDSAGYVYVGTQEGGILRSASPITSVMDWPGLPTGVVLHQNYPNPFNGMTTVEFFIPHSGDVELAVYNALGQRVATLLDGRFDTGWHRVTWHANNHASGLYFCRLKAGAHAQTGKVLLIR